jgi:transcriptional regulator of heat shock response
LQDNENSLVIQYVHIRDRESDTDTTAKLELIRKDTDLSLVSTDVATGEVIKKIALPPPVRHDSDDHRAFETIEECIAEFDSSELHATLLAEANRSCESQLTHVTCCLTDGSCWSVVLVIEPSFLRCRFGVRLPRHPELEFYKE